MYNWDENIIPLPSDKFSLAHDSNVLRKKMESGYSRQRRRYTSEFEAARLVFNFTEDQYAAFKATWFHRINAGSDWFTMRLPLGDGQKLTLTEIRFTDDFKAQYSPNGNWRVNADIEFKTVIRLSDNDLAIIESGGTTTPYPDRGITFFVKQTAGKYGYIQTESSSGFNAVQWWDGTTFIFANGSAAAKAISSTGPSSLRCEVWACLSAVDSTPVGNMTEILSTSPVPGPQEGFTSIDFRRESLLERVYLQQQIELEKSEEDATGTLVLPTSRFINSMNIREMKKISTVNWSHSAANGSVKTDFFAEGKLVAFGGVGRSSIQYLNLNIGECERFACNYANLTGHLDLSSVTMGGNTSDSNQVLHIHDNPALTGLTLGSGDIYSLRIDDCSVSAINFTTLLGVRSFEAQNNVLSVEDIKNIVDNIQHFEGVTAPTIYFKDNPAEVGGFLDPADPLTPATYSAASAKGITLNGTT